MTKEHWAQPSESWSTVGKVFHFPPIPFKTGNG